MIYDAFKIEKKWQKYWSDKNSFESNIDFKTIEDISKLYFSSII